MVHHLVVDTVSWQVMLDDLVHLYESEMNLPQSSDSYANLVSHLQNKVANVDNRKVKYWLDILETGKAFRLPLSHDSGSTTEAGCSPKFER